MLKPQGHPCGFFLPAVVGHKPIFRVRLAILRAQIAPNRGKILNKSHSIIFYPQNNTSVQRFGDDNFRSNPCRFFMTLASKQNSV
jgi:hypothetical protein